MLRAWVIAVVVAGCGGSEPDPIGPLACGDQVCAVGQLCMTRTAGQTCDTDEDTPPFGIIEQYCADMPEECGGVPSCDCITSCYGACFDATDGRVSCGCY